MKPILVCCHIYYPEMWTQLKTCIMNISPYPFQLYVTMIENHESIASDIKTTFKDAQIEIVPNRGYDIGPFLHIIHKINLDNYSYVVKLHTKRDMPAGSLINHSDVSGSKWRDMLLSFVGSSSIFSQYLKVFEADPSVGMQADHRVIVCCNCDDAQAQQETKEYLKNNHFLYRKYAFVAGTMFIARTSIFKDLQNVGLSLTDFPAPTVGHNAQLAHTIERFLGYLVYKNNMILRNGLISDKLETRYYRNVYVNKKIIAPIVHFLYQSKLTKHNRRIIKICKIPVYWRKV